MKSLTVFTPTYNRAYSLPKLYESLCKQTSKDFLWLIVDDGSTDNTKELIESFLAENYIGIQYIYQNNGGKHSAHNRGADACETDLFVCVDSDDRLTSDAVALILDKAKENMEKETLGFYFRKASESGKWLAGPYPAGLRLVGITDLYHKYCYQGDTVIVLKTKYLKQCHFPVFENEKFVTERVLYNQMNSFAPMVLCDEVIYHADYLKDGYTKNQVKLQKNNPYGTALDFLMESKHQYRLKEKAKCYAQYLAFTKIFKLDTSRLGDNGCSAVLVRLLALMLLSHYLHLYQKLFADSDKANPKK